MISLAFGTKVFLACLPVDLRNGFDGLAAKVQQMIGAEATMKRVRDVLLPLKRKGIVRFLGLQLARSARWALAEG